MSFESFSSSSGSKEKLKKQGSSKYKSLSARSTKATQVQKRAQLEAAVAALEAQVYVISTIDESHCEAAPSLT